MFIPCLNRFLTILFIKFEYNKSIVLKIEDFPTPFIPNKTVDFPFNSKYKLLKPLKFSNIID